MAAKTEPTGAYPDYLPLNGLASRWGGAIGVGRDSLAKGILIAFSSNEFDGLSIAEPLILINPTNLQKFAVSKEEARALAAPWHNREGRYFDQSPAYVGCVRTGYGHVHPGVIPTFARARGLTMPAWLRALAEGRPTAKAANKGGRPNKYDWAAIEAVLEKQCRLYGSVPHADCPASDWRTAADAMRFLHEHFEWTDNGPNDGPSESQLRANISPILERIDASMKSGTGN